MIGPLVRYWLIDWIHHGGPRVAGILAAIVVTLTVAGVGGHGVSLAHAVLGGPDVVVLDGRLQMGSGWTWLVLGLLFVVASFPLIEGDPAGAAVLLVRGASRRDWALSRLIALAVGALAFEAILLSILALAVVIGWRPGPFLGSGAAWDLGLWALALTSLGWVQLAVSLVSTTSWTSLVTAVLLLGCAAFGGNLAPFLPVAQSIIALHHLPGTLTVADGAAYLLLWTVFCGFVVWVVANRRVGYG